MVTILAVPYSNQDMDCVARSRARIQNVVRSIMDFISDLTVFACVILVGLALIYYYANRK
jgi:hypothetical protein